MELFFPGGCTTPSAITSSF